MKIPERFAIGCCLVALITLAVAALGYWQTERLARALHEVGAVRLPSIHGLDRMRDGLTQIAGASRLLVQPGISDESLAQERERLKRAWDWFESGWRIYEPLPQTAEEAALWREFVPVAQHWRRSHEELLRTVEQAHAPTSPRSLPPEAVREEEHRARVARLLRALDELNHRVADEAMALTVANQNDVVWVGRVMLVSAIGSALAALLLSWTLLRRVSRPMAEALRESEERFREVMEHSSVSMTLLSVDGRMVAANPACGRLLGYSVAELRGRYPREFTHPEDVPTALAQLAELRDGKRDSYSAERRMVHKDGRVLWARLTVLTLRDRRGCATGFVAQFNDITEQKRAAQQLAETAERLRNALEVARLGVWRRNLKDGSGEWDERAREIFGVPERVDLPSEAEILALVLPEDRPVVIAARRNIHQHRAHGTQLRVRTPSGETRHVLMRASLRRDAAGEPDWLVGVVADVTESIRASEESGRLREQLRHAQKMEALGTMAAGVAHDFNNLLTGINGFIDLGAASLPHDHEVVGLLEQARRGATSARALVRRILSFARQTPVAERELVSLTAIVRDTAPLIVAGLPPQITLSIDCADTEARVKADPGQMQQVLLNLCVNGAHAIGAVAGAIRVSLAERVLAAPIDGPGAGESRAGEYVCLSVEDSGCGMSPEVCARIFEPFFTTKKAGVGTGLGLAMVQEIVASHGGFVRVDSEPGRGTCFAVYYPKAGGVVAAPTAPTDDPQGEGEQILVVDDDAASSTVARKTLEAAGYVVDEFNDPTVAWSRLTDAPQRYSLLLIDYQMPGLTGADFAARVRHSTATLPIIIMTGRSGQIDLAKLQELGGIGVLAKPFDGVALVARISEAIRRGRARSAAA